MNMHISDFQVLTIDNKIIVISEKGVTKINSRPMALALKDISKLSSNQQTKTRLTHILEKYNLNIIKAFEFLEAALKIQRPNLNIYFTDLIIAHNRGKAFEKILSSEITQNITTTTLTQDLSTHIKSPNTLLIIIPNPYDHTGLKSIYYEIAKKHPTVGICVALRMGDYFYVSQPYLSEIGSPCHYCNFDKINHTEHVRQSSNTWSTLLKFCTDIKLSVPEPKLSYLQQALAVGLIIEKIRLWTCPGHGHRSQDSILLASYVHLFNGQITEEHITHWQMCDCLRPT